nr:immunoglobulin heavy chain junction region [Macaca mulatta]
CSRDSGNYGSYDLPDYW